MGTHRILRFAACCLLALGTSACFVDHDDDGGGGLVTVVDITGLLVVGEPLTISGTISPSDVRARDGSYLDLYLVTPAAPVNLSAEMRSAEVDSYLFLFTDDCLGLPLNDWGPCLLRQDDDGGTGPNDAFILAGLMGNRGYVIAANTYFPNEFGSYTLEVLLWEPPPL